MSKFENTAIAIQKKGRLCADTLEWLNNTAGTDFSVSKDPFNAAPRREIFDTSTGITVVGFSNSDIARATTLGMTDFGVVGSDKILEAAASSGDTVSIVQKLGFGVCRLAFAISEEKDNNNTPTKVATSYPSLSRAYLDDRGLRSVDVDKFSGGIEMVARRGGYDAIVDIVCTGRTLEANGFVEVDTLYVCEASLIAGSKQQ